MKVHKSKEDKARKAAAKNVTAMAEARKRKGPIVHKSVAASANDDEEVAENIGGGSGSTAARTGGERSAASLDFGGNNLVDTAL